MRCFVTTMATPKGGYDCDFVNDPPSNLECAICLLVLREPHVITCCGNHFCRPCIERVQNDEKPCPLCNDTSYSTFLHKGVMREVNALLVRCPQKELGCKWEGELGYLEQHLNPGAGKNGCGYVQTECGQCGEQVLRGELQEHELEKCPHRSIDAVVASILKRLDALTAENQAIKAENQQLKVELAANKQEVVQLRDGLATKAEVVQLDNLATKAQLKDSLCTKADVVQVDSLATKAQLVGLATKAQLVGLATKAQLDDLATKAQLKVELAANKQEVIQLREGLATKAEVIQLDGLVTKAQLDGLATKAQLDDLATKAQLKVELAANKQEVVQLRKDLATKEEFTQLRYGLAEVRRLNDDVTTELETCNTQTAQLKADLISLTPLLPFVFIMSNYEHFKNVDYTWLSDSFYTHHGGYKMRVEVHPNGVGPGRGSHLTLSVHVIRGENDDKLQWPFRGEVTIQAYNREAKKWDKDYIVIFNDSTPFSCCSKPPGDGISNAGWGPSKYISHGDMKCFVANSGIRFRVFKIDL